MRRITIWFKSRISCALVETSNRYPFLARVLVFDVKDFSRIGKFYKEKFKFDLWIDSGEEKSC